MKRLAFMASGNGTNAENLIKKIRSGVISADPAVVICDQPGAGVIERARSLGVPVVIVERREFEDKAAFEAEILRELGDRKIDLICLAGYMRILGEEFVKLYWGRIINVHPAYLPAFPGAHSVKDAFEAKAAETGVTIHFVDTGVDSGPIILQRKVAIDPNDSLESLATKIHAVEYELYPEGLNRVLSGRATMAGGPR
ncbi:MAG: phosphoribosylglycinamide formyltransferase [Candidatus Omnitrophota bacterium]|nr:phosphoribosylglycinamide formyltransferase [Candidatus Omnitrophota bacterium]